MEIDQIKQCFNNEKKEQLKFSTQKRLLLDFLGKNGKKINVLTNL